MVSYALQIAKEINSFEPTTYHEAISFSKDKKWTIAMNEGMESL